jgi:hypothetical protein
LYSKALSDTEVLKNFNASKTRYGYSWWTGTNPLTTAAKCPIIIK